MCGWINEDSRTRHLVVVKSGNMRPVNVQQVFVLQSLVNISHQYLTFSSQCLTRLDAPLVLLSVCFVSGRFDPDERGSFIFPLNLFSASGVSVGMRVHR